MFGRHYHAHKYIFNLLSIIISIQNIHNNSDETLVYTLKHFPNSFHITKRHFMGTQTNIKPSKSASLSAFLLSSPLLPCFNHLSFTGSLLSKVCVSHLLTQSTLNPHTYFPNNHWDVTSCKGVWWRSNCKSARAFEDLSNTLWGYCAGFKGT